MTTEQLRRFPRADAKQHARERDGMDGGDGAWGGWSGLERGRVGR